MTNTIHEYTDPKGKSPYAVWLHDLRDARAKDIKKAKEYWKDHKLRNQHGP